MLLSLMMFNCSQTVCSNYISPIVFFAIFYLTCLTFRPEKQDKQVAIGALNSLRALSYFILQECDSPRTVSRSKGRLRAIRPKLVGDFM